MKEYIKSIPITTILLLYMFFCGGLNLVGYWGTFDIKVSEWVSIWEIPKAVISPFAIVGTIVCIYEVIRRVSINHRIKLFRKKNTIDVEHSNTYIEKWKIVYLLLFPIFAYALL